MNLSEISALTALLLLLSAGSAGAELPVTAEVLTNAAQVRSLSAAEAAEARPVRLRGVVVDAAFPNGSAAVLADDTADIYLLGTNLFETTVHSDFLEVEGVTDPGQFAPIVKVTRLQKTGTAPLPSPKPFSFQQLISGALDAQWVEISGVVHSCLFTNNIWRIHIAADGGMLTVRGWMPCDPQMQEDAEVRLQALCFYQFNQKRQLLTPVLQVPRHAEVQILKPAPANPFAAPLRLAEGLLQFSPESSSGHRVHVRGVVTYCQPGATIWIHDQAAGLRIRASQPPAGLAPGDVIDVLGFPALDSAAPVLEDAIYRKSGTAPVPAPHFLTNALSAFDYEADLIALDALITGVQPVLEGTALELRASNTVFKALLKNTDPAQKMPDWQPGSRVRVAGICSVVHDEMRPLMGIWQPRTFQILLRSPADLAIFSRPSWWTPLHISYLLGCIIGGLLLLLGLLALAARRRLNEQNHQRAMAEAEFAAILAERNRMAREIHDTLAQGLVATSVQLRLAKKQGAGAAEALLQHLDSAQQLVRRSLQDARDSIWNMRSQALENGDLATALRDVLRQLVDDAEIKTAFDVTGTPRRLAPMVENNLLRVGQEAMTNAAKHAQARQIRVQLDFGEKQLQLRISDDGRGFDPVATTPAKDGFGLVGMRERIAAMQGELHLRSAPGQGTEIHVTLPLAN